ncbi:MAG: DUF1232 domain-containing protein [Atopobiaceae bacterium]|jgi:uncharacterized membrane protein YkvA (DUF1232 family)|nr:DUF1232 domain-containing protein [Atopobiaceae bacterium]
MPEQFSVDDAKQVIENGIAQAQELMSDPAKIDELMKQLQQKVKELPSAAGEALGNIPLMASMVKSYVTKEYAEVSPKVVASLVSAFLYIVTKKDLIDDSVPVLGMADDLAVVALAMKVNENELAAYKQWRDAHNLPEAQIEA